MYRRTHTQVKTNTTLRIPTRGVFFILSFIYVSVHECHLCRGDCRGQSLGGITGGGEELDVSPEARTQVLCKSASALNCGAIYPALLFFTFLKCGPQCGLKWAREIDCSAEDPDAEGLGREREQGTLSWVTYSFLPHQICPRSESALHPHLLK